MIYFIDNTSTTMKPGVDNLVNFIQESLKKEYDLEVPKETLRGPAFSILKQQGILTKEDKYKTYPHVAQMLKLFNESFETVDIDWEDMEHFTGNLFYAMRAATKKALQMIQEIRESYEGVDKLSEDLFILEGQLQKNMKETWAYIEKTQLTGAGMIIAKLVKGSNQQIQNKA